MVLLTSVSVFGAGSVSLAAGRSGTNAHHARRCRVPSGWGLALSDSQVLIVKRGVNRSDASGTTVGTRWRYCLRQSGRFQSLFEDVSYYGGYGDIVSHASLVLKGQYLAFESVDEQGGGRYGCSGAITIENLGTRRSTDAFDWGCDTGEKVTELTVNSRGFAAWHLTYYPVALYTPLTDVSCASVSLCIAVDSDGKVVSSSDPSGGRNAWTSVSVNPGNSLITVSCPTVSFCAALSYTDVFTSNDPVGGASAWHAKPISGGFQLPIHLAMRDDQRERRDHQLNQPKRRPGRMEHQSR
jgi:hypothetical protein